MTHHSNLKDQCKQITPTYPWPAYRRCDNQSRNQQKSTYVELLKQLFKTELDQRAVKDRERGKNICGTPTGHQLVTMTLPVKIPLGKQHLNQSAGNSSGIEQKFIT